MTGPPSPPVRDTPIDPPDWYGRALGYPYDVGRTPLLFRPGGAVPLPDDWSPVGRVPVLAVGSNRAAQQLARKFAGWPAETEIPVTVAEVIDHDVVYSAHFASYGAIPARLAAAPGVRAEVGITWLTPAQLACMHETERGANYTFTDTVEIDVVDRRAGPLGSVGHYAGRHPPLRMGGQPLALAAIAATGRRGPAAHQDTVLGLVRDRLEPGAELAAFLRRIVTDDAARDRLSRRLRALGDLQASGQPPA
ncbi:MAG: hypothetical protein H6843_09540 [Rhodospirillaceae bacterium]|nr:hypothetical protein [Rhodospirillaceae bacterium]